VFGDCVVVFNYFVDVVEGGREEGRSV